MEDLELRDFSLEDDWFSVHHSLAVHLLVDNVPSRLTCALATKGSLVLMHICIYVSVCVCVDGLERER